MTKKSKLKHMFRIDDLDTIIFFDLEKDLKYNSSATYTNHPTSIGTPISDHKYNNFKTVNISGRMQDVSMRNSSNFASDDRISSFIEILQDCMNRGYRVDILTRFFDIKNMYVKSIDCNFPNDSVNTADINISFTEIITSSIKATKIDGYTPQNVGSVDIDEKEANKEVLNKVIAPTQLKDQPLISYTPFESKQDLSYNLPYMNKIIGNIESTVGKDKVEERYIQNWSNPLNWG